MQRFTFTLPVNETKHEISCTETELGSSHFLLPRQKILAQKTVCYAVNSYQGSGMPDSWIIYTASQLRRWKIGARKAHVTTAKM